MKKLLTLLLAVTCVCGCSQTQNPTDESKTARIPMIMVDGELYMDTGYDSTIEGRCGVMDGEITSTVDGTERPIKDNQSNFGKDIGYQYGTTEGTIEIYQNEKWRIFALRMSESKSSPNTKTISSRQNKHRKSPFTFM